jgi:uncharacterized membrane protein YoaK (UPF0700 family)
VKGHPVAGDVDRTLTRLMLGLTFGTGVVDAAGYLGLHKVFIANMTGNVVFIGLGLAGHDDLPVTRSLAALVGFVAGAFIAGRLQRGTDPAVRCPPIVVGLLGATSAVIALLAIAFAVLSPTDRELDLLTLPFAVAMGIQAGAARRLAVTDVSTVVITSTLASLAADSRFAGGQRHRQVRRLVAVLAMCVGALVGAVLLRLSVVVPLALAAAIAGFVTAALSGLNRTETAAVELP